MKPDEGAHPMDINLLRPYAVVQIANALAQLVEHFHGLTVKGGNGVLLLFAIVRYWMRNQYIRRGSNPQPGLMAKPPRRFGEQAVGLSGKTVSR